MADNKWPRLLAYVTGLVNQKLLLQNEYLIDENRILRKHPPKAGSGEAEETRYNPTFRRGAKDE
jgi:hypothetical protein